jgi:hypothetical protein
MLFSRSVSRGVISCPYAILLTNGWSPSTSHFYGAFGQTLWKVPDQAEGSNSELSLCADTRTTTEEVFAVGRLQEWATDASARLPFRRSKFL